MGKLYLMVTIVDRKIGKKYQSLYKENEHHVMFSSLGFGTAASEILNFCAGGRKVAAYKKAASKKAADRCSRRGDCFYYSAQQYWRQKVTAVSSGKTELSERGGIDLEGYGT